MHIIAFYCSYFFSRLGLIIKLSVVMGITFIFEIVSSFYDFHPSKLSSLGVTNALTWIEIILDSINCCQGIIETCWIKTKLMNL